jgi:hypothetical protein
MEFDVQIR